MCIDQVESKGPPQTPERRQAAKCHEKAIEASQDARNCEEPRKADLYPILEFTRCRGGPVLGAQVPDKSLKGKPRLRRDHDERHPACHAKHPFPYEKSGRWLGAAGKERREHHNPRKIHRGSNGRSGAPLAGQAIAMRTRSWLHAGLSIAPARRFTTPAGQRPYAIVTPSFVRIEPRTTVRQIVLSVRQCRR